MNGQSGILVLKVEISTNNQAWTPVCENMGFDRIARTYHTLTYYCFTSQGQTSDAPPNSSTVRQGLRPPHFVQIFDNVYFPLSFHSLGSLNDIHINAISLQ